MTSRVALLLILLTAIPAAAADLPPGALVRLGDDRFRAGSEVTQVVLSPDGKQFATARTADNGLVSLAVWDAATGRPIRERQVNGELFQGIVWGPGGAFVIINRAEAGTKGGPGQLFPDDFCVWDFSDPKAVPPPVFPPRKADIGFGDMLDEHRYYHGSLDAIVPRKSAKYTRFLFSSDGRRVAARWESASGKHAVHVFDLKPSDRVAKLTPVANIDLGAEGAKYVYFLADGKTVITSRVLENSDVSSEVITIWDVATGEHSGPWLVPSFDWVAPDGRAFVTYVNKQTAWGFDLFDLTTKKSRPLIRIPVPRDERCPYIRRDSFAFTPNGRKMIVGVGYSNYVIDLTTGKQLARLEGHAWDPSAVAVSPDGTRIATADIAGLVRLWDAKTFRPLHEVKGHSSCINSAELSPDGKRLLTGARDDSVRLWDLATGAELRAFTGSHPVFVPDGTTVVFSTEKRLLARDLQTGLEVPLPGAMKGLSPQRVVFAADGKSVLTCGPNTKYLIALTVWDWPTGKKRFTVNDLSSADTPGFSPDGAAVFANGCDPKRWDAKTGEELPPAWTWKEDRTDRVYPLLSLRPNPRSLLFCSDDGARVLHEGTGKQVPRFRLVPDGEDLRLRGIGGIAVSGVGGQYAWEHAPDESVAAQLREAATGQIRRTLSGHRGGGRVLGFTPDGTKLLTAGSDHTVLVWDMRLQSVPLPEALKKETNAAKLWGALATGSAKDAYLAMARLAREPEVATKLARMKLTPAKKGDAASIADARAIELLETLDTADARALLKELASGHADAFRTQEAKRAIERHK